MRWKVEIREGRKERRTVSIEAESWLAALARAAEGKSVDLSNLTVDLQMESIRVLWPAQGAEYVFRESRGIPKSAGGPPRPSKSDEPAHAAAQVHGAPVPTPMLAAAAVDVGTAQQGPEGRPTTPGMVAPTLPVKASEPAQAPKQERPAAPVGARESARVRAAADAEPRRASVRPPIAATLLSRREQNPNEASPIWYRELAYAVPIATDESVAEAFAMHMLEQVTRESAGITSRFVNIAIFDEIFTGEPTMAPLVIVEWKDWKGPPISRFPRRVAVPEQVQRSSVRISQAPPTTSNDMFLGPVTSPPKARTSQRPRLTGDALIAALFDKVHQVSSKRDGVEAGYFCLDAAISRMQVAGGFVHFYDEEHQEFVLACARGPNTEHLLGSKRNETDPFLASAIRTRVGMLFAGNGRGDDRFTPFGGVGHLALAPIWANGRFMGALELFNPPMGTALSTDDATAVTYLGEQLAEFFGSKKAVVDSSRISKPPPPADIE
jgi:hypothetical protein